MRVESLADASAGISREASVNAESSGNPVRDSCFTHSRRADQRRKSNSLNVLSQQLEEDVVAKEWMLSCLDDASSGKKGRMTYLDMKSIIEKRLAHQKKGFLSDNEVAASVKEFQDLRSEEELNEIIVEEELRRFNKKMLVDYNNSYVGNMSVDKEDGRVRFHNDNDLIKYNHGLYPI